MTGSTRNPQPQAAGGSPEGQEQAQAELLDAEELAGEEVLFDDEEVDVIEEDAPEDAAEAPERPAVAAAPAPAAETDDESAAETAEMSAVTLKTTVEDVLASLGLDASPAQREQAPVEETPAQGTPAPALEADAAETGEPAVATPRMPIAAAPPKRALPPEPDSSIGAPVPTPRMAPVPAPEEPTGPLKTLLMDPAPEALTPALPPPVALPRLPPPLAAPALPAPRSPSARPPAPAARADFDAAVTNELPRTTLPMVPRPARPSPVPLPPPEETTPTGRVAVPPRKREGTDPMMKAQAEPPRKREGTDPMMKAPPERRREGTDPMMKVPPEARRDGEARREGTDPMMKVPPEARREGTDPMMKAPAAPAASRTAPSALVPVTDASGMTGAFAAVTAPEQVLPFRARTGTIPPERPAAADLSGVLPFRPAARSSPGLNEPPVDTYARMTPADPIPASRREPSYIPAPGPMSASGTALAAPNQGAQALPYGAAAASNAPYPPAPTPLAAMHSAPASPEKQWGRQDKPATSSMPTPQMLVPPAHEGLPFHAAHAASASQAAPLQALPPQAMPSQGSQPMMQAVVASAPPPASPPRPAALPMDAWKLQPSSVLFPFAASGAVPQAQPQPAARAAGPAMQPAQPYGQSYAAGSEPGIVAPASLGLNAPRLTLEQYACMAAELAVAPANAVQVRARYGLDDSSHLAEQGAWQRRFSLDAQLFASYSSLFQHYRDWLSQSARR